MSTGISGAAPTTIVLIDDDESRRYVKARTLRNAGFEVIEAATGEEGLRVVRELRPRLAIIDVGLPDMSGHEVCRLVKTDPLTASLPVLQISASFVTEADTVASLEGGADASLTEPIEPQVLIATVRALLRARKAEDAMREALGREQVARVAAEDANRVRDEFLAVLSHELRSPLGSILTWATLLQAGNVGAARLEQGLAAIERNAKLQSRLIEDLLDVSRIISGKSVLETRLVELGPIIAAAMDSLRAVADAKGIRMESIVDPTVGPLVADPERLQQVMWNLLSNAVKFSGRGRLVRVETRRGASKVLIRVTDAGIGISSQFLPHVFERFRQADSSTTRAEGGLGLGLAIVSHMVQLHGGTVRAESPGEGQGATFSVELPLPAVRPALNAAATPEHLPTATLERLDGLHVLVVDDEIDAREAIMTMLETCGAAVIVAANVGGAIDAMKTQSFDTVISDIGMPGQDGYALIHHIREVGTARGTRVLALSAYANTTEIRRMQAAGFDVSLTKPVDARNLVAEVARLARMDVRPTTGSHTTPD